MAGEKITFYDIMSKHDPPQSWSPNTFKTKTALKFKGIPFEIQWMSYPDIAPTFQSLGAEGYHPKVGYTCPAISSPSHPVPLMDSLPIAEYLEKTYAGTPALFPPGGKALAAAVQAYIDQHVFPKAYAVALPRVPAILDPQGAEYFERTRKEWFGMELKEYAKTADIDGFYDSFKGFQKMLSAEEGPFLLGETPSYGDLIIVSFIEWFRIIDISIFEKILTLGEGSLKKLYEASKQWL